jgi:hypothetical protein
MDGGKVEIQWFGSKQALRNRKAPALWTNNREAADKKRWQHRGMIRSIGATQRNKWQQKRMKTHNGVTLNVKPG